MSLENRVTKLEVDMSHSITTMNRLVIAVEHLTSVLNKVRGAAMVLGWVAIILTPIAGFVGMLVMWALIQIGAPIPGIDKLKEDLNARQVERDIYRH